MALFGIKKIKNNNTFINNDVINAPDDVTVPDNNVDYDNFNQDVTNEPFESTVENVESTPNTFVYSQVDNVDAFNNNSNQLDDSVVMTVDKNVFSAPAEQVMTGVQAENYQVNTDQQAVYIPQPEFSSEQAVAQDYNMNQTVQADYNFSQQDAYVSQPEFSGQDQVMYGNQTEYSGEQQSIQTEYVPQPEFSDSPQNMEASQVTEESPTLLEEVQPITESYVS